QRSAGRARTRGQIAMRDDRFLWGAVIAAFAVSGVGCAGAEETPLQTDNVDAGNTRGDSDKDNGKDNGKDSGKGSGSGDDGGQTLPECSEASDCPTPSGECVEAVCSASKCSTKPSAKGTPVNTQVSGDCQVNQCDGSGNIVSAADDTD